MKLKNEDYDWKFENENEIKENIEKQNLGKNEKLQNQLKNKEKELENVKSKISKNIELQFESDCKIGEYMI